MRPNFLRVFQNGYTLWEHDLHATTPLAEQLSVRHTSIIPQPHLRSDGSAVETGERDPAMDPGAGAETAAFCGAKMLAQGQAKGRELPDH
eukprot:2561645-Prymnesium_polylepis.2